jgi:hypothetical protein
MAEKGERVLAKYHDQLFLEDDDQPDENERDIKKMSLKPAPKKKITKGDPTKPRASLRDTINNVLQNHMEKKKVPAHSKKVTRGQSCPR